MLRFAVDVDGVLFERATYPDLGKPNWDVINTCKILQEQGHKVYMYTSRGGLGMEVLEKALKKIGFVFDPYDRPESGKIRADFYVDDRNIQPTAFPRVVESFLFGTNVQDRCEVE